MSTITREWLQQKIAGMEATRDEIPFGLGEDGTNTLAALRIALASLEAEASGRNPVLAYADSYRDMANQGVESIPVWSVITDLERNIAPLFTATPAPVSVPDAMEMDDDFDSAFEHGKAVGWNAYRAAMLQGAEPVSNRDELPDGWVACSERMPNIGVPVSVPVITSCGDVVHCAVYVWDGKEWQDWYEEYDKLPFSTFTHWMPLPAAPQQEVK